jgi:multidrug efflux pump
MGKVQNQFFPDSSRPEILVDLWFPEGTSYAANEAVTKRVEARVMKLEGVDHVTTWVGSGVPRFVLVLDQIFPQSNVSQMVVLPKDLAARERLRKLLPELLATEFPEVRARAKLLPNGPPVPYPVQFRVVGPDPTKVRAYADEVKAIMRTNPTCAASTTTGTNRSRCCGWTSTRTRRARSACPASPSRRPRARSTAAPRWASTATATS